MAFDFADDGVAVVEVTEATVFICVPGDSRLNAET